MEEKNLVFASYRAALEAVMDRLASRRIDLRRKHIVLVPDRCTLTAERMLCERFGGSFDAFVTTWSRLFSQNVPQAGYLSRQGGVMLIRKILEEKAGEIKCYRKSRQTRGFASKLYDTIGQLAVCDVSPDEVRLSSGGTRADDIALIYREYLRRTEGKYADAAGRMKLLANYLAQSDYLKGATVYVACFDAYTKQMRNILDIMRAKADEVAVFDTAPTSYRFGDTVLYAASSPVYAAKAIVAKIADEHRRVVSYDDMCVVTADARPDELKRIFRENGIPCAAPSALPLGEHALGRFLSAALAVPVRGYRSEDLIRLSKNPFVGVEKRDSDAFERYVRAFGITYKLFLSPFTLLSDAEEGSGDRRMYDGAERARGVLAHLIELLQSRDAQTFDGLRRLVAYARTHYTEEMQRADDGRANPFERAEGLIALCETLMRGADDKVVLDALVEGMSTTDLASRPRLSGVVEIGSERDFRARTFKHIFVADFNTDAHPMTTADGGLLSDDDIADLRGAGVELSPTTAEVNKRARDEFFLLLASAERLTLVHTDKPAACTEFVRERAKSFVESGTEADRVRLRRAKTPEEFLDVCPTRTMLIEEVLAAKEGAESGFDEPLYYAVAREAVGKEAERYAMPSDPTEVPEAGAFMLSDSTKVTQLEAYFACPMKHWLTYGLQLRPVPTSDLKAADVGSVLHEVAEKYVAVMDTEDAEKAALRLLADALEASGKKDDAASRRLIKILTNEAVQMCRAIRMQIECGGFRPAATEQSFGLGGDLEGVALDVGGRRVTLRGRIDRMDVCDNMARIVDYKTGRKTFDLTEAKCGVEIQLLVYLAVLIRAGYRPAGAFYFSTLKEFGDKREAMFSGVCACEDDVLTAMDEDICLTGESSLLEVKKTNPLVVGNGETEFDLVMLTDYALKIAARAAEEITGGYIAPAPFATGSKVACNACDFRSVCGFEGEPRHLTKAVLRKTEKTE